MKLLSLLSISILSMAMMSCETAQKIQSDLGDIASNVSSAVSQGPFNSRKHTPTSADALIQSDCPQTEIIDELGAMIEFTNMTNPGADDMISRIDMTRIDSTCSYKSKTVTMDINVLFKGMVGPQGRANNTDKPSFSYPFFVAVVSPGGNILAKEVFSASLNYGAAQDTQTYTENLRHIIPITSKNNARHHKILVGFQLSPEQLAYNRALIEEAETKALEAQKQSMADALEDTVENIKTDTIDQ